VYRPDYLQTVYREAYNPGYTSYIHPGRHITWDIPIYTPWEAYNPGYTHPGRHIALSYPSWEAYNPLIPTLGG